MRVATTSGGIPRADARRHPREQDRRHLQHQLPLLGRSVALQDLEHLREAGRALVGVVVQHFVHLRAEHRPEDRKLAPRPSRAAGLLESFARSPGAS